MALRPFIGVFWVQKKAASMSKMIQKIISLLVRSHASPKVPLRPLKAVFCRFWHLSSNPDLLNDLN